MYIVLCAMCIVEGRTFRGSYETLIEIWEGVEGRPELRGGGGCRETLVEGVEGI